jgi:WD40 repeat protein
MMLRTCAVSILVLIATQPESISAGSLRKVWDVDLKKEIEAQGSIHTRDLPVFTLRFSPDGRKLAAVVDLYGPRGKERSHLIILNVDQPQRDSKIFEISGGLSDDENGTRENSFGWSPSREIVYADGRVIRLKDDRTCDLPSNSVFIQDHLAMGVVRDKDIPITWDWKALATHFTFFNADCQPTGKWDVPEAWSIVDVAIGRGLLSISRTVDLNRTEELIVDPLSRAVLRRSPGNEAPGGKFADSASAICDGSDVEAAERAPVTCWEVDSGKKIGEAPTINGGDPMATALHASRVVASDYRRRKVPFSSEIIEVFRRRVVWDFRSGKELASWRPDFQSWDYQIELDPLKPLKHVREPFKFAISPDGEYIVEGGNGIIRLYKIEP